MNWELVLSLVSIVGIVAGVGALLVVGGMQAAIKSARTVIDSLKEDNEFFKGEAVRQRELAEAAKAAAEACKQLLEEHGKQIARLTTEIEGLKGVIGGVAGS